MSKTNPQAPTTDSRPENQVLAVIFYVDFEFWHKICGFRRPGAKIWKKVDLKILTFNPPISPFFGLLASLKGPISRESIWIGGRPRDSSQAAGPGLPDSFRRGADAKTHQGTLAPFSLES